MAAEEGEVVSGSHGARSLAWGSSGSQAVSQASFHSSSPVVAPEEGGGRVERGLRSSIASSRLKKEGEEEDENGGGSRRGDGDETRRLRECMSSV